MFRQRRKNKTKLINSLFLFPPLAWSKYFLFLPMKVVPLCLCHLIKSDSSDHHNRTSSPSPTSTLLWAPLDWTYGQMSLWSLPSAGVLPYIFRCRKYHPVWGLPSIFRWWNFLHTGDSSVVRFLTQRSTTGFTSIRRYQIVTPIYLGPQLRVDAFNHHWVTSPLQTIIFTVPTNSMSRQKFPTRRQQHRLFSRHL